LRLVLKKNLILNSGLPESSSQKRKNEGNFNVVNSFFALFFKVKFISNGLTIPILSNFNCFVEVNKTAVSKYKFLVNFSDFVI
jgi:hypothetical protein